MTCEHYNECETCFGHRFVRSMIKLRDEDAAEVQRLRNVIRTGGAMYRAERCSLGVPGGHEEPSPSVCTEKTSPGGENPGAANNREERDDMRASGQKPCSAEEPAGSVLVAEGCPDTRYPSNQPITRQGALADGAVKSAHHRPSDAETCPTCGVVSMTAEAYERWMTTGEGGPRTPEPLPEGACDVDEHLGEGAACAKGTLNCIDTHYLPDPRPGQAVSTWIGDGCQAPTFLGHNDPRPTQATVRGPVFAVGKRVRRNWTGARPIVGTVESLDENGWPMVEWDGEDTTRVAPWMLEEVTNGLDAGHSQGRDAGRKALKVDNLPVRGVPPDGGSVAAGTREQHSGGGAAPGREDHMARVSEKHAPRHEAAVEPCTTKPVVPPSPTHQHFFNGDVCWLCHANFGEAKDFPPIAHGAEDVCSRGALYCVLDHDREPGDCHDEDGRPAKCIRCSGGVTSAYHENGARCHRPESDLERACEIAGRFCAEHYDCHTNSLKVRNDLTMLIQSLLDPCPDYALPNVDSEAQAMVDRIMAENTPPKGAKRKLETSEVSALRRAVEQAKRYVIASEAHASRDWDAFKVHNLAAVSLEYDRMRAALEATEACSETAPPGATMNTEKRGSDGT